MESDIIEEEVHEAAASISPEIVAPSARELADEIIESARAAAVASSKPAAVEPHNLRKRIVRTIEAPTCEKTPKRARGGASTRKTSKPKRKQGSNRVLFYFNFSFPK